MSTQKQVDLEITGMSCGGCVKGVTAALSRVPGVVARSVGVGKASIQVDSDAETRKAIAEIGEAGFVAKVVSK